MALTVLRFVLLFTAFTLSFGLERSDLYAFGPEAGDRELILGDESKDVIEFPSPFEFYDQQYNRAYVSLCLKVMTF